MRLLKSGSLLWLTSLSPSVVPSFARSEELPGARNLLAGSHGVGVGWVGGADEPHAQARAPATIVNLSLACHFPLRASARWQEMEKCSWCIPLLAGGVFLT